MSAPSRVSFGLIADIQYADADNGHNFARTKVRYYRGGLKQVQRAIDHWSAQPPNFVLQLGDIIDGVNRKTPGAAHEALRKVLEAFSRLPQGVPVHHLVGNHELYNFSRREFRDGPLNTSTLNNVHRNTKDSEGMYYSFLATHGLKVIVLDTYDMSVLGFDKDSDAYKLADNFLRSFNKNEDLNDGTDMPWEVQQVVAYNGAMSRMQLDWLDRTLSEAEQNKENVIIVGHQGVSVEASGRSSVCWNHSEIMDLVTRHNSCVVAYISGHSHWTGYSESQCVPFISLHGVIETPPGTAVFATAHVYEDRVQIVGSGCVPSHTLPLKHRLS